MLREDPASLQPSESTVVVRGFEVLMTVEVAGRFSGPKTFIEDVERIDSQFYAEVGQYLRVWQASPPRAVEVQNDESTGDAAKTNFSNQDSEVVEDGPITREAPATEVSIFMEPDGPHSEDIETSTIIRKKIG